MNCTLSVLMITYKHEKYIEKAIAGILMQNTDFNFEFIIVDDCSPDSTSNIVRPYLQQTPPRIEMQYYRHDKNRGASPNFLFGVGKCKGEYIAFCEGDDYWTDPLKLQKQVNFLEDNPEYIMVYHGARMINEQGELLLEDDLKYMDYPDYSSLELIQGAQALPLTVCYRNVIKDFPPEMFTITNQDTFLSSLLGNFGKGKYLADIEPAHYRVHEGGMWSLKNRESKLVTKLDTFSKIYNYYNRIGKNDISNFYKKEYSNAFKMLFVNNLKNRKFMNLFSNLRTFKRLN